MDIKIPPSDGQLMDFETVGETPPRTMRYLPQAQVDRAELLCERIEAVANSLGEAVTHGDALADAAPSTICFLIQDMARELRDIVSQEVQAGNA